MNYKVKVGIYESINAMNSKPWTILPFSLCFFPIISYKHCNMGYTFKEHILYSLPLS